MRVYMKNERPKPIVCLCLRLTAAWLYAVFIRSSCLSIFCLDLVGKMRMFKEVIS